MILLEQLAQERTNETLFTTLSATIEATARMIAQEILADPAFRAQLKAFTQRSVERAMRDLHAPAPAKRTRKPRSRKTAR